MSNLLKEFWRYLGEAANTRAPFNFLQLSSIGADGSPQLRTIVLRACSEALGTISFATDIRSPKVQEIASDPRVALLGFDPNLAVQIRMAGVAAVVTMEERRQEFWSQLRERVKARFSSPIAPGTLINGNHDAPDVAPASLDPYRNFAVIEVELLKIEWLDVGVEPHVRSQFKLERGSWHSTSVAS
jgi:pyridoxamine 5'-phosphate oxidase